ncbi:universal stress protein [Pararhizobium haloflavum]|uniref:universal stress protein n=1 Tax=Pararhizobium haloflavum TaxID=2037914 RepID=UPI000C184BEB|nr:universal stress protein [Pararhizobium haloflavum]
MAYRTLLNVAGIGQGDGDINIALDLCEEINAHLSLFLIGIAAPPPVGEYAVGLSDAWLEEREEDLSRLGERAEALESILARRGLSADLASEYVEQAAADNAIGVRARYADLAMVGPDTLSTVNLKRCIADGVLFHAQRPLLLVPSAGKVSLRPRKILVGWNSSLEAARAVREAADMIAAADDVRIVMVDPQSTDRANGPEPGADVAAFLARHGARVTVDRLPSAGMPVADLLKRHATDMAADMIVVGAYGHTRLRERLFGGVTRSMLDSAPVPVFMAR